MQQSSIPIVDHIKGFLEYLEIERGIAKRTQVNYQRSIRRFEKWLIDNNKQDIKPHELTTDDIWLYRVYISKYLDIHSNPLSKVTQNLYLIILRSFLNYFLIRDITSLPPGKVTLSKYNNVEKPLKFLNLEQVKKLLDSPDTTNKRGLRDKVIFEILFSTGLRVSELTALNKNQFDPIWNEEDFELGIIGKGNHPRTVFFSKNAVFWLKKYLESRKDNKEALFINYRSSNRKSERLSTRSVERITKDYAIKAGLPTFISPHVLRHSYATDLLSQGVDLRSIQEFLGHKNIITTQIYTHVTNKHLRDIHRQFHGGRDLSQLATQSSNQSTSLAIVLRT